MKNPMILLLSLLLFINCGPSSQQETRIKALEASIQETHKDKQILFDSIKAVQDAEIQKNKNN